MCDISVSALLELHNGTSAMICNRKVCACVFYKLKKKTIHTATPPRLLSRCVCGQHVHTRMLVSWESP